MSRLHVSNKWNFGFSSCLSVLSAIFLILTISTAALGGDDQGTTGMSTIQNVMPPLGPYAFGTDHDNEDNAGTGRPDYDMDKYLYNDSPVAPIEFNIRIPLADANKSPATIRMDVYDVDSYGAQPEVDEVYVNGVHVGTLHGANGEMGINIFDIPIGTLKRGKNLVQIKIDTQNWGWAVRIDWAVIYVKSDVQSPQVMKAWFAPLIVQGGDYINAYAVVSGAPTAVKVYYGKQYLFSLTDPDGDFTYSGQFQIPSSWPKGYKSLTIKAFKGNTVTSVWPNIRVK